MGLNFLGLGFSFGAKDAGLDAALGGINNQFKQLDDSVKSFQATAAEGLSPAEGLASDLQGQLSDLQKDATAGVDLGDAIDLGDAEDATAGIDLGDALDLGDAGEKAKEDVGGLTDAMGDMATEAALGGTGFGRMANSVLGGAGKITGAMGWVGLAIGPIISGFGEAAESAGGMVDAVTGLPARAGAVIHRIANEGINLTNSLEGEAVALGQTARAVGANMGYVGRDLQRFIGQSTGMAMGLNIGADEAARAIRAWDESAETLGATGLSSARDLARLTAGLGINADVLRNSTLELRNLGAEDEQIHRITSALTMMGRETGDVSGALNELPQIMQMLERRRALGDTPEQMTAFATDTAAAARGLFAFTQDSERARSMAADLAGQVTESREAFQNMFAGVEDQLPQLVTELAITRGEVQESFRLMEGGPGGLIEAMGNMVQATRAAGGTQEEQSRRVERLMEFMRGRLQQVFGTEMTATLTGFWRTMDSETVAAMGAVRNASVDLSQLGADAHSTGRTMQEVFERMKATFQTRMRRGGRGTARQFLQETRESLDAVGNTMERMARSTGPLGDAMAVLSNTQTIGALALLPEGMRGTAIAADALREQMMPLIQAFSSWGGLLNTAVAGVALFATEVMAELDAINKEAKAAGVRLNEAEAFGLAIDRVADNWATKLTEMIDDIEGWVTAAIDAFAELDFGALFETPAGGEESGVMRALRRIVDRLGEIDWRQMWGRLREGFTNLFKVLRPWFVKKIEQIQAIVTNRIGAWWEGIDWGEVFSTVRGMGAALWEAVEPAISLLGSMISGWLQRHWLEIVGGGVVILGAIGLLLGAALIVGFVAAFVLLAVVFGVILAGLIILIYEYFASLGPALSEIWQYIVNFFSDTWEDFTEWFEESMLGIDTFFTRTWRGITRWFKTQLDKIGSWWDDLWNDMAENVEQAVEDWRTIFSSIEEFFAGIGTRIRDSIGGAISWIRERWVEFVSGLQEVWKGLSAGWDTFLEGAEEVWDNLVGIPARLETAWGTLVAFFRRIFSRIREAIGDDLQQVGALFQTLADVGTRALDLILGTAEDNHQNSIHTLIGDDLVQAEEVMTETSQNISAMLTEILHDATVEAIVTGFSEGFASVVENMGEFSEGMVEQFTTMAEGISEIMTDLFVSILGQATMAMLGTEIAVEGIIGRLRTITAAQARLAEARSGAIESLARPADDEAMRRRLAQLRGNEVLRAIHHPDWYSGVAGRGGYQRLFERKMSELHTAIIGLGTAPGTGTLEGRQRLIREAREAVTRARVGGHAGVPGGLGR